MQDRIRAVLIAAVLISFAVAASLVISYLHSERDLAAGVESARSMESSLPVESALPTESVPIEAVPTVQQIPPASPVE